MSDSVSKSRFTKERIGALTALLVPLLYVNGYTYDQGYLNAYGVGSEFFHRAVDDYLIYSFFAFFQLGSISISYIGRSQWLFLSVACLMAALAVFIGWMYRSGKGKYVAEKKQILKQSKWFDYFAFPLFSGVLSYVSFNFLFVLASLFIMVTAWPYFIGKYNAKTEMSKYKECKNNIYVKNQTCVYLYEADKIVDGGLLVARSEDYIAIYNGKEVKLHRLDDQKMVIPRG